MSEFPMIDRLWGCELQDLAIDLAGSRVVLNVVCRESERDRTYLVQCSGVREVRGVRPGDTDWDYVEITAATASRLPDGSWDLDFTTWVDEAGISIRCEAVTINGEPLAGKV